MKETFISANSKAARVVLIMIIRLKTKRCRSFLWTGAVLLGGALLYWSLAPLRSGRDTLADQPAPVSAGQLKTGIVSTRVDSRGPIMPSIKLQQPASALLSSTSEDPLSPHSQVAFRVRRTAIRALKANLLTADQVEALHAFVADSGQPEGLTLHQMRALKNDIVNILCAQPEAEEETAVLLRAVYADSQQDLGIRDYALQHLDSLAEREPQVGLSAHWDAIGGSSTSLTATALLHLSRRHERGELSEGERKRVEVAALKLASDVGAKDPNRTTAIEVCGRIKLIEARVLALKFARSEEISVPLRIAAVAALGDLGGSPEIHTYLAELATGPEKRLRVPAAAALQRFSRN